MKQVNTIEEYFIHEDFLQCIDFVQCANRGCSLDDTQIRDYKLSLLAMHGLTVLEEVSNAGVVDDEGSSASSGAPVPSQSVNVIKWNFPPVGDIFRSVIRNFIHPIESFLIMPLTSVFLKYTTQRMLESRFTSHELNHAHPIYQLVSTGMVGITKVGEGHLSGLNSS